MSASARYKLGEFNKFRLAVIVGVGTNETDSSVVARLLEMGFLEGARVEVVHEAPFGGDPIAVRVRGTLIALRRSEANMIEVVADE